MTKSNLLQEQESAVVNVASVPMRSPFRYAGGKTWLIPKVRLWLNERGGPDKELIEIFAGGGIVSLTAVFEGLVSHATLVELDEGVAAVWKTVVGGDGPWLGDRIMGFDLTPESAKAVIEGEHNSTRELAFATIVKNRVNRGGILAEGASFIKYGENGKGIRSRWYPGTLRRRILEISALKDRFSAIHGDAFEVLVENKHRGDAVYFIDPPYVKAGRRLYNHSEIDHCALFDMASQLEGDFLMTYDNHEDIRDLAQKHSFDTRLVPMKSTHHQKKFELLVGRDLSWADED